MFRFFVLLFILIPLVEIGVFIQIGGLLGLLPTLVIIFLTAILGVHLLREQGLKAWVDIKRQLGSGQIPAVEMAAAAQLLFAGGLLLTPGFVTDAVGFALMIPAIRTRLAKTLLKRWAAQMKNRGGRPPGRIIDGDFEDHS